MKALQVTGPGETAVIDIAPPIAKAGEVLLRVRMVGMCGSDLNTFRGTNPNVSYPRILGHEIAATVQSMASDEEMDFSVGSDVAVLPYNPCGTCIPCRAGRPNTCEFNQTLGVQCDGAMAEMIAVPSDRIYHAGRLNVRELALVEPLSIGFHAVRRGQVTAEDTVAVFGCGGVGLGAVAGAAHRGATVIGIDVDEAKLNLAKAAGATFTIHSQQENLHERLLEYTGGRGPHVVIEAIGLPATFRAAVEEVAFAGRVVYIGYAKDDVSYQTRLFVLKELDILGSRNATRDDFREVASMLQAGGFPVDQAISEIVPLAEAGSALAQWSQNPSRLSKILVTLDSLSC